MFKFIFAMFFLFLILVFLMGFSILRTVRDLFLGKGRNTPHKQRGKNRPTSERPSSYSYEQSPNQRKKLFTEEDGEYVDYEEIKD